MSADEPKKITTEDAYRVWCSIDASLKALVAHFGAGRAEGPAHVPSGQGTVPHVASDADLDGKYGDPEVKAKSPRDWTGDSQQGKRFSECPPEYLDLVASRLDYFAEQNAASEDADERKKARFNRLDASRARGWAARLRNGWKPAEETTGLGADIPADSPLTSDDIPFAFLLACALAGHAALMVLA